MSDAPDEKSRAVEALVDQRQDEQFNRVVEVLNALPIIPERRKLVGAMAEILWFCSGLGSDYPSAIKTGTAQAAGELLKLRKLAKTLVVHLNSIHRTAIDALERHNNRRHRLDIAADLVSLSTAALRGTKDLRSSKEPEKKAGRPRMRQAEAVTDAAADVFEKLTGTLFTGTPNGRFHVFLEDLFKALRVEAKPAGQVNLLEKRRARS